MTSRTSPFKFLDAYTYSDRDIFFGRDQEIKELYHKIFESRILLLYGISGTGKTSLINCGLANKFEEKDWLPINIRRGRDVNRSLKEELHKLAIKKIKESTPVVGMVRSVYLDHFKPIYLIFDQFEELFIFGDRQERDDFIHTIKEINGSDIQCKCLFSIREEYLAGVTEFENIIPEFLSNRMRVERMTRQNAGEVITGPCRVNGIQVEEGFSDSLLKKLNPETAGIELTYLQVFLDKIFRLSADSNKFTLALIDRAGDVSDLLGSFLDEQVSALNDAETGLVVLKAFVSIQGTKKLIGVGEIEEFARTLGKSIGKEDLKNLLQSFVNLRVLKDKDDHELYELRHDSLAIKIYEKFTLVEKELLEIKEFLVNAYSNFQRRGIYLSESDLHYIAPYEDKIFLGKALNQFVADSRNELVRIQRRRRRWIAAAAIALITILTFFTGWAMRERTKAIDQSMIAEEQRTEAINSRDLAIQAQKDADRSRNEAENSRAEAEAAKDEALMQKQLADSALVVVKYQRSISEEQRERAESLFEEANEQRQIALSAQQASEELADEVTMANRNAMLQLYLFNAKEFANKSLLMNQNDTLKALLALTSYDLISYGYSHFQDSEEPQKIDIEIYEAVQKAFLEFVNDTLYNDELWSIDYKQDLIAVCSGDHNILLADVETATPDQLPNLISKGKVELSHIISDDAYIRILAAGNNGRRIAAGSSNGTVGFISLESGVVTGKKRLYAHEGMISSLVFSLNQDIIASGALDKSLIFYDIEDDRIIKELNVPDAVMKLVPIRNNRFLLLDRSGRIHKLDLTENGPEERIMNPLNREPVESFSYSVNTHLLATANSGKVYLYGYNGTETELEEPLILSMPRRGMISGMTFSPDGKWLAISSLGGSITLWNVSDPSVDNRSGLTPIVISKAEMKIIHLLFDPGSNYLIYSNMESVMIYPLSLIDLIDKLRFITRGRIMTENEWATYIKGNLIRPEPASIN